MRVLALPLALLAAAPALAQPLALESPNAQPFGEFGIAVAGVPDADGDGRGDLLVGAFREDGGAPQAGRVYLFSGTDGHLLHTFESPDPEQYGFFGAAVAGVPDADGDGRGDLLIGAIDTVFPAGKDTHGDDRRSDGLGRAYLFSGATGALLHTLESPNPEVFGFFGASVAGVPDVDGDGRGDFAVGASGEDVGGDEDAGRAYVYSGATGQLLRTMESPGLQQEGRFGSVAGVPDADGDGRGDLLVGASTEDTDGEVGLGIYDDQGRAYLFSGATGALLRPLESPLPSFFGFFGSSVSGVPDVDGDRRGDLLVGEPTAFSAGQAYVYSGATGQLLHTLESPNPELGVYRNFGSATAGLPDVDGDGRGDLGVGAPLEDVDGDADLDDDQGRAYVYSGATGEWLYTLRSPDPETEGYFGTEGAGLGDVDGDGLGDGVVGAYAEGVGGRVYLYRTGEAGGAWVSEGAVAAEPAAEGPAALTLSAAPNPLSSATTVRVSLPHPAEATLDVLDVLGRRVALLHEGTLAAGPHALRWAPPSSLPGGVYLLRLRAAGEPMEVQPVTLAR